jgi:hypothetical protein
LIYATLRDNRWDFQTITPDKVEWIGDIAVDSNCDPHVIYYAYQEQPLPDVYGHYLNHATIDLPDVSSAVSDSALPPVAASVAAGAAIVVVAYFWKKKK